MRDEAEEHASDTCYEMAMRQMFGFDIRDGTPMIFSSTWNVIDWVEDRSLNKATWRDPPDLLIPWRGGTK